MDGIAYPSVKCDGAGFNVCIKLSVVDECITFKEATVSGIIKDGKETRSFQIANSAEPDSGKLKWKPTELAKHLLVEDYGDDILNDPRFFNIKDID